MNPAVSAALQELLSAPTHDTAIEALRAVEAGIDTDRRLAIDHLEATLRATPERRERHVADVLIALRRAGDAS